MDPDFLLRYEVYRFFKTISDSFKPTPLEIVFIVLAAGIFAAVFIGVYRHQKKKALEGARMYARTLFDKVIKKARLNEDEKELLVLIAQASPAGELKRYIVLQRAAAFDEAAGILIDSGEIDREEAAELRDKLIECCFTENHGVASTKDLPAGLHLYIIEQGSSGFHGEISLKTADTLHIELRDQEFLIEEGRELTFYFKRGTDTYFFKGAVHSSEPGEIALQHPQKIKKVQRRRYYRKEVRKQGVIQRNDGKHRVPTIIFDLGGGGASVKNRDNHYKRGDSVFLAFSIPEYGEVKVSGRVVRTSKEDTILHIEFDPMKDQARDKIITHILQR